MRQPGQDSVDLHRETLRDLPPGFRIHRAGDTGICVIDNFCTPAEAQALIDKAEPYLGRSQIRVGGKNVDYSGRISDNAMVFGPARYDPALLMLMHRAAMLVGLPYYFLESLVVTRYGPGGFYEQHIDHGDNFRVDRLYTVLLYLNTLEPGQGGETIFQSLNLAARPQVGRAVSWVNKNPDGSGHLETNHAAAPIKEGAEKWVVQFWFHAYRMFDPVDEPAVPLIQNKPQAPLPDGVRIVRT